VNWIIIESGALPGAQTPKHHRDAIPVINLKYKDRNHHRSVRLNESSPLMGPEGPVGTGLAEWHRDSDVYIA